MILGYNEHVNCTLLSGILLYFHYWNSRSIDNTT
jgi:hypothetical protein